MPEYRVLFFIIDILVGLQCKVPKQNDDNAISTFREPMKMQNNEVQTVFIEMRFLATKWCPYLIFSFLASNN